MLTSRRNVAFACALSALAGYVDGIGFIHLGGVCRGRGIRPEHGADPDGAVIIVDTAGQKIN